MEEFVCKDINGDNISKFVFNDDGTIEGVISNTIVDTNTYNPRLITDKTVSLGNARTNLSRQCCEYLGFTFDNTTNNCYWSVPCGLRDFKVVFAAQGDEGAFFDVDENEECTLEVKFDYLIQFDCDKLLECKYPQLPEGNPEEQPIIINLINLNSELENIRYNIDDLTNTRETIANNSLKLSIELKNKLASLNEDLKRKNSELITIENNISKSQNTLASKTFESNKILTRGDITLINEDIQNISSEIILHDTNTEQQLAQVDTQLVEANNELNNILNRIGESNDSLNNIRVSSVNSINIIDIISGLDICVTIEKETTQSSDVITNQSLYEEPLTIETVYEESLFKLKDFVAYITNNLTTGFRLDGGDCDSVIDNIITELGENCELLLENTFSSNWLSHMFEITDPSILSGITNEKIKLGIKVKNCLCDFSILIDNIELNKKCVKTERDNVFVAQCPSFELRRVIDNKKSWVVSDDVDNRMYDLSLRESNYDINNYKLGVNTKEMDLDVSPSSAIETDVWCFSVSNPCIFSCSTAETVVYSGCVDNTGLNGDIGVDLNSLITTDLSNVNTVEEFTNVIFSELIDAKDRKTLSGYPTLKLFYERYVNSLDHCGVSSSAFDYGKMNKFLSLLGDYWVDLIEQVVPSTTLWGSTVKYGNTVFDSEKHKYKRYTLFTCDEPTNYPLPLISSDLSVEVITNDVVIPDPNVPECFAPIGVTDTCNGVYLMQINDGSEFIGSVKIITSETTGVNGRNAKMNATPIGDVIIINEEC